MKIEINYQPINRTWGVFYRKGNILHNEINSDLKIAMGNMADFILNSI